MIESFTSGTNISLVTKIETKYLSTSCLVYQIWNDGWILMFKVSLQHFDLPDMIGSFANGTTASLVPKMELKNNFSRLKSYRAHTQNLS